MVAESLISNEIIPLKTSDTGDEALSVMNDFYVKHLPIVNNHQFLGLISEDDILNHDVEEAIGSYFLSITRPYVNSNDHIFDVMRVFAETNLTVIPVINNENDYVGLISLEDLLRFFTYSASFTERGSIIVLEMNKTDYSLSEISRIVESENATILSSFVTSNKNSSLIEVTLKVNRQNLQAIIATFVRFNYSVKASFSESDYFDNLKDRYDSLMSYLNV